MDLDKFCPNYSQTLTPTTTVWNLGNTTRVNGNCLVSLEYLWIYHCRRFVKNQNSCTWRVVHISHACSGNVFVIKEAFARACLSCKVAIARTSKFGPRWGEGIMCSLAYDTIVCYECRWLIEWVTLYIIPKANSIVQSFTVLTCFLLYVWWSTWFSFSFNLFVYVHCMQKHCTIIGKTLDGQGHTSMCELFWQKKLDFTNVNKVLDGFS